jgi:hypothetical protein
MSFFSSSPSTSAKGSTSNPRRHWLSLAKPALGVALAMGALTAGQARAVIVNVDGLDYDVTTFTGNFNDITNNFTTAANGGIMAWWDKSSMAYDFPLAVSTSLRYWNSIDIKPDNGPSFAVFKYDDILHTTASLNLTATLNPTFDLSLNTALHAPTLSGWLRHGGIILVAPSSTSTFDWAKFAPASSAAVPGPLPALGAAAAFGYSRKLRQRIKCSTKNGSGAYCI